MVVLLVALVMVLAELGFNVTTIVAGTSVVAAAIAFGTQSIIKDLLAGIFMLVEDQLGVGDFVDMQLASGTVEEIGLRVTQLRADDGTVWYVRNGEVLRLANFSKGGPTDRRRRRCSDAVELVEPKQTTRRSSDLTQPSTSLTPPRGADPACGTAPRSWSQLTRPAWRPG